MSATNRRMLRLGAGAVPVLAVAILAGWSAAAPAVSGSGAVHHATGPQAVTAAAGPTAVWSVVPSPNVTPGYSSALASVSCPAAQRCVAVGVALVPTGTGGARSLPLVERSQGNRWVIEADAVSGTASLAGVTCPTSTWCVAVGERGGATPRPLIEEWQGAAWTVDTAPGGAGGTLTSVSCVGTGFCMATGSGIGGTATIVTPPLAFAFDGTSWSAQTPGLGNGDSFGTLHSVSCVAATACVAVGATGGPHVTYHGLQEIWSGTGWTSTPLAPVGGVPNGTTGVALSAVSCVSASWCLGVGTYYTGETVAFSEPWNGTTWGAPSYAGAPDLSAVTCSSPTDCRAVGSTGTQGTMLVWSTSWVPQRLPTFTSTNLLDAISCRPGSACVAVGNFFGYLGASTLVEEQSVILASTGYRMVASDGGVFCFTAPFHGSMGGKTLNAPMVGIASDPTTGGYWTVASDGGVFAFTAPFFGSMGGQHLNEPIVGMVATPTGKGYWLVASDGGIFAFGDAGYHGSTGNLVLNRPVVGMAATASGAGYWLVASDGGIFAFTAPFLGSRATPTLGTSSAVGPVTGISSDPTTGGYRVVTARGTIGNPNAAVGQEADFGTLAQVPLAAPVVAIVDDPGTSGYWMLGADGGVFTFNAPFLGSMGGTRLAAPIVGGAPA